jgi:hypothetical protein
MLVTPRVQQNASRDRFFSAISLSRRVYGVQGEQGLARLESRRMRGRDVCLFWSDEATAMRWAQSVASKPRIKDFSLTEMLASLLPGLAQHRRFVGLDWLGEEGIVDLDPTDFAERLRIASLDAFVHSVKQTGAVFTIEGPYGPALLRSQAKPDGLVLPCWANPGEAYSRLEGPWRDMLVIKSHLSDFIGERLAWLSRHGHLVGPDYQDGPGALEMQPADIRACFRRAASPG